MRQDPRLKLAQARSGVHPELVPEHRASLGVRLESRRLPPAPVEGEHRLAPAAFAVRLLLDHRPTELGGNVRATGRKLGRPFWIYQPGQ